jgi:hypothetical protein
MSPIFKKQRGGKKRENILLRKKKKKREGGVERLGSLTDYACHVTSYNKRKELLSSSRVVGLGCKAELWRSEE